ncbi:hypothetical protein EDC04DRAFT_2568331, partial [Pisolithus marmoratus]
MEGRFLGAVCTFKTPEPLNDSNWVAWKGQIMPMLELNKVWAHCDSKRPEWDMAEQVARIIISNNLTVSQFVHVLQATTVKQMWENLKSVHESRGQQSI